MFVNGVEVISSHLENISLKQKMQPKSDRPPVCPKNKLPLLHLTPSTPALKKDGSSAVGADNPCLLKAQHDIPATPPPQIDPQPVQFFPQRIG